MSTSTLQRRLRAVAAVATALAALNVSGSTLAATDGSTDGAAVSTTVPARAPREAGTGDRVARRTAAEAFKTALGEWKQALASHNAQRKEIVQNFRAAVQAAGAANEAAGKTEASKAAMRAAIAAAKSARETAVAALGPRPERPARP